MYYLALCIVYKVYKVVLGALGWPSMQLVAGSSPAGESSALYWAGSSKQVQSLHS